MQDPIRSYPSTFIFLPRVHGFHRFSFFIVQMVHDRTDPWACIASINIGGEACCKESIPLDYRILGTRIGLHDAMAARTLFLCAFIRTLELEQHMETDNNKNHPDQRKWDEAGPEKATGRKGGGESESYNEGREAEKGEPGTTYGSDVKKGPLNVREGRERHEAGGMAESLGGPSGGTNRPSTENERRFGGSHTAGSEVKKTEESEWKGGTPDQGPTSGGMGSAGGGHDTDETDVWKKKNDR